MYNIFWFLSPSQPCQHLSSSLQIHFSHFVFLVCNPLSLTRADFMNMGLEQSGRLTGSPMSTRLKPTIVLPSRTHQFLVAYQAGTGFHEPTSDQWLTTDRPNRCRPSGNSSQCYCVIIVVPAMPAQKMAFCRPSYIPVLRVFPPPLPPCLLSIGRGDVDVLCRAEYWAITFSEPLSRQPWVPEFTAVRVSMNANANT